MGETTEDDPATIERDSAGFIGPSPGCCVSSVVLETWIPANWSEMCAHCRRSPQIKRARIPADVSAAIRVFGHSRGNLRPSAVRGQVPIELFLLMAIVIGGLLGAAVWVKRGLSGQLRSASDSFGEQYHPRQTTAQITVTSSSYSETESNMFRNVTARDQFGNSRVIDEWRSKTVLGNNVANITGEQTSRTGWEQVDAPGNDLWQ